MKKTYRMYKENIIIEKSVAEKIKNYMVLKEEVEPIIKSLRKDVKDEMISLGKDNVISNGICLSLKNGYDKTTSDTETLKKDYPKIYDKYKKTTSVDSSVTITVAK